jgi:hypothetical protein
VPGTSPPFAEDDGGVIRCPQEQTMLRMAHSIRKRRPQAGQLRYVPAR